MKVYLTIGLPGSGKSTWAKQKVQSEKDTIIVNRDIFRTMIKDKYTFDKRFEPFIKDVSNMSIVYAFENDLSVIVDETHIKKSRRMEIVNTINELCCGNFGLVESKFGKPEIVYVWFTETKKNLANRMKEPRGYSSDKWNAIIRGMKKTFEAPEPEEGYDELIKLNPFDSSKDI